MEVSKWAALILFMNRAYSEAERAMSKLPDYYDQPELKQISTCLSLLAGRFSEAGPEG